MTGKPKDGGLAFPSEQSECQDGTWNQTYSPGMSLRDWFAGQALAGIVTRDDIVGTEARLRHVKGSVADLAYEYADAMLAARDASE
jgi:hypothetical protein